MNRQVDTGSLQEQYRGSIAIQFGNLYTMVSLGLLVSLLVLAIFREEVMGCVYLSPKLCTFQLPCLLC